METLTLVNGNNHKFNIGLPKIVILGGGKYNEVALAHITENTGLMFTPDFWDNIQAQPETSDQIIRLFMTYNFKTQYYNNWESKNTLYLKSDHHVGFHVDSICFECCKENNIHTGDMKPGSRLAC